MEYSANIGVIICWNPDQNFVIHRDHHVWFDGYNYCIFIDERHNPGSLLLRQDPEGLIHNSQLLNLIPRELDITFTPFFDTTNITYEIYLPTDGKKIGFNLLDDKDFTIHYVTDTIPNSSDGHQLPTQATKKCVDHCYQHRRAYQISRRA